MADKAGVTGIGAPGVLTLEILVNEYSYSEDGKTYIRLDMGNHCFFSFTIPGLVEVPKYIHFEAQLLRRIKE